MSNYDDDGFGGDPRRSRALEEKEAREWRAYDRIKADEYAEKQEARIAALESELAQARAECERFRVDAERYRWARDQRTDDGIAIVMKNKHIDDSISYPDNIDRYIDARKEGK